MSLKRGLRTPHLDLSRPALDLQLICPGVPMKVESFESVVLEGYAYVHACQVRGWVKSLHVLFPAELQHL